MKKISRCSLIICCQVSLILIQSCNEKKIEVSYHSNGSIKDSTELAGEIRDGFFKSYYESGSLLSNGNFRNNNFDGKWEIFYESGKLQSIQEYDNNQLINMDFWSAEGDLLVNNGSGILLLEYSSGKRKLSQSFLNSILNGESKTWYENGKLESFTSYSFGEPCGAWTFYDSTGTLESTLIQDLNCE